MYLCIYSISICVMYASSLAHRSLANGNNECGGISSRPLVITDLIMSSLCHQANVMMMFQKCYEPHHHSYKTPSVGLCFGLRSHLAIREQTSCPKPVVRTSKPCSGASPAPCKIPPVTTKRGDAFASGRGNAMQMRVLELYQGGPEAVIIFSHHASSAPRSLIQHHSLMAAH